MIVLSHYQTRPLLAARQQGQPAAIISPDLGLTTTEVRLGPDEVIFPTGEKLAWADVRRISSNEKQCFLLEGQAIRPIHVYSEVTNWVRTLFATPSAPTTIVAGFPMHRIQNTNPREDTLKKIAAIAPIVGRVLDTATGLGYTAIEAARTAEHVTTIELDPAALELARLNPWSRDLFDNPRITQLIGDAAELIETLPERTFARIIHDPPIFNLAGDLYSSTFYSQLYRVLTPRGQLFHYIGDLTSHSGARTAGGVIRRLQEAGFRRVVRHPEAFGVVALKTPS
jgi:predicted methyltransferase